MCRKRFYPSSALAILAVVSLILPGAIAQTPPAIPAATVYELPETDVFPEGVAVDPERHVFYVGSTSDGAVYRGDLASGEIDVFLEGNVDGRTAVTGIKVAPDGRLIVAGRNTGQVFVYDIGTGELLARYSNGLGDAPIDGEAASANRPTLINDIAITPDGVSYVTDSFTPVLYRIPAAADTAPGAATPSSDPIELEVFLDFTGTAFTYEDGFNANGIVATPDGRYLLVVQYNTGRLYRIEIATTTVTEVELGGAAIIGGDGLALDGQTLYAVTEPETAIVPITLDEELTRGTVGEPMTNPTFDYPTTMALVGDGTALVVNSQLDMTGAGSEPDLPFTVSRVTLPSSVPPSTPGA